MTEHQTLSSEKYYVDKLEAEAKVLRRHNASQSIKSTMGLMALFSVFAVCGYALFIHPTFVPDCIDFMRTNGILSY